MGTRLEIDLHEEKGRAEASNKVIIYSARALLKTAKLAPTYWGHATRSAIFQGNCVAPVGSSLSPFEAF